MADTAVHLVDRVLPRAPVFTVPKPLRLVLAREPGVDELGRWDSRDRRVAAARRAQA